MIGCEQTTEKVFLFSCKQILKYLNTANGCEQTLTYFDQTLNIVNMWEKTLSAH